MTDGTLVLVTLGLGTVLMLGTMYPRWRRPAAVAYYALLMLGLVWYADRRW